MDKEFINWRVGDYNVVMKIEDRVCGSCKGRFTVPSDDVDFYTKISVPAPTWCPRCRQQRRYAWRNERVLYRRNCDLCGKSTVTIYSPNKPFKVYCPPCWWGDSWSALDYGRNFDFSKPFFPQWQELQLQVPRIALLAKTSVNSDYTNHAANNKNCYLSYCVFDSENILYSSNVWKKASDCMDCAMLTEAGTLLYECIDSDRCYNCQFSSFLRDCSDCLYCYDCRGCQNCFLSYNLRNKQYCILNEEYTKEEYFVKIAEWKLSSYTVRRELWERYVALVNGQAIHKASEIERSVNVSGSMIFNSKNVKNGFDVYTTEDSKNMTLVIDMKDSMDVYHVGFKSELVYESHGLTHVYNVLFSHLSYDDSHLMYCDTCHNSENLFGCVGLKKVKHAIFNKQYSEEEYATLKTKIVEHMKTTGEYGEFFPPELSLFGYNETQGHVYMPMSREEALGKGYKWEEQVPGTFGKETLKPDQVPDSINDVTDSITKEILACGQCGKNYNIVQPELELYRRMKVPLPRLCPDCRYRARIALRPPRELFSSGCACTIPGHSHGDGQCLNVFETPLSPKTKNIVYCEPCYQAEVV